MRRRPTNAPADDYHPKLARLKLWYVWHLVTHEGVAFDEAINQRVRLHWYFGSPEACLAPPEWFAVVGELRALFRRHDDAEGWEQASFSVIASEVNERVKRESAYLPGFCGCRDRSRLGARHHGCVWEGEADALHSGCFWVERNAIGATLALHFANVVAPESPFDDTTALAASLLRLIKRFETRSNWARCASWLNSLDVFLELFPRAWRTSATGVAFDNHSKWWGQFRDRSDAFNEANASRFRRTGHFPYRCLLCQSTLRGLIAHLEQRSGEGSRSRPGVTGP